MRRGLLALALVGAAVPAGAAPPAPFARSEEREPCSGSDPLRRAWFGDLHVHTSFSFDAWGQGTRATHMIVNSQIFEVRNARRYAFCGENGALCREAAAAPWREIRAAAEAFYDRSSACRFTTFVGYEWSGDPDSNMIHRNVVFRNAVVPELPASYLETADAEGLWRRLRADCQERGDACDVLAIPHNSNLSGGLMFRVESDDGVPIRRENAEIRNSLEVLVEVTQHKGDSECRAGGRDELCGFETLPFARMAESASPWMYRAIPSGVYVREALGAGLREQQRLGVNPFKLGLIGSTDTHLGTPGLVDEKGFPGHAAGIVSRRLEVPPFPDSLLFNPGGLAVLWAEENSRDALFAAMRRREAYATSGPRLTLRLFGGWRLSRRALREPRLRTRGLRRRRSHGRRPAPAPCGCRSAALRRLGPARSGDAGATRHAAPAHPGGEGLDRGR